MALGDVAPSIFDLSWCLGNVIASPHRLSICRNAIWSPPPKGIIKVNMDRSYSNVDNRSGIRGVSCNLKENILLYLAKYTKADSTVHAKVLPIKKDMFIAAASCCWSSSMVFHFEINSSNVVAWFLNQSNAPCHFQNLIRKRLSNYAPHIQLFLNHVRWTDNESADMMVRIVVDGMNFIELIRFLFVITCFFSVLAFNKISI